MSIKGVKYKQETAFGVLTPIAPVRLSSSMLCTVRAAVAQLQGLWTIHTELRRGLQKVMPQTDTAIRSRDDTIRRSTMYGGVGEQPHVDYPS
jgi:hypothetical protein